MQHADQRGHQIIQSGAGMPLEPPDALITLDREPAIEHDLPVWFRVGPATGP
jgi:hypothetical protein